MRSMVEGKGRERHACGMPLHHSLKERMVPLPSRDGEE